MAYLKKYVPNKKTHEEFLEEVNSIYGEDHEYEFLTNYDGCEKDIRFKHHKCGQVSKKRADRFLNPKNKKKEPCPFCSKEDGTEKFKNKVKACTDDEYLVLGRYIDSYTPILIKHKECNYEYEIIPNKFLTQGKDRCPICDKRDEINNLYSQNEILKFIEDVYKLEGSNYTVLCEFGERIKFKIKHNICKNEFYCTYSQFVDYNKRCANPLCTNITNKFNLEYKIYEKYGSDYIALEEYIDSDTEINFQHNVENCMHIFKRKPRHLLIGKSTCPECCRAKSRGEEKICSFLEENEVDYIREYSISECKDINILRFDFAIFDESKNIKYLLEYDGRHHFEPVDYGNKGKDYALKQLEDIKNKDAIKNKYCIYNKINLIRIPYWKLNEIEAILFKLLKEEFIDVNMPSFIVK